MGTSAYSLARPAIAATTCSSLTTSAQREKLLNQELNASELPGKECLPRQDMVFHAKHTLSMSGTISVSNASCSISACARLFMSSEVQAKWVNSETCCACKFQNPPKSIYTRHAYRIPYLVQLGV